VSLCGSSVAHTNGNMAKRVGWYEMCLLSASILFVSTFPVSNEKGPKSIPVKRLTSDRHRFHFTEPVVPRFVCCITSPVSSLTLANEPLVAGYRRYPLCRFIFSSSAFPTALFGAVFPIFVEIHVSIAKHCQVHHSQGYGCFSFV
jgi:hypothetical protein